MHSLPLILFLVSAVIFASVRARRQTSVLSSGANGPYSHAVRVGNTMYISALIATNETVVTFVREMQWILNDVRILLATGNMTLRHVVKTTVILTNWDTYDEMNDLYREYFPINFPARSAFQVATLPKDCRIAIDAVAVRSDL